MNEREFRSQLNVAESHGYNAVGEDYMERAIHVVDEEGFVHKIEDVFWDPADGCFWVHTSFREKS